MNKILTGIAAAALIAVTGCKTTPTVDTMYSTSYAIGVSAALVMNQTKINDTDRNIIIDIVNTVNSSVPSTNTTFTTSWTPIAQQHVDELVANGKIDASEGSIIMSLFAAGVKTLDYVVYKRYPVVGQNVELLESTTHGFCTGLLTYYKPADSLSVGPAVVKDEEAYTYMSKLVK